MGRRSTQARKTAEQRIDYLYTRAREKLEKHPDDSRKAIEHMRRLATKHNIQLRERKKTFCKECNTLLVPGTSATVRVKNDRRIITCEHCGHVKRLGLD